MISSYDPFVLKTSPNVALPFCLSPTFIEGIPIKGASIIPLEELPITTSKSFNEARYKSEPIER